MVRMPSTAVSNIARNRAELSRSSASVRFRSVISWAILEIPITCPELSLIGEMVRETSIQRPSLVS